MAEWNPLKVRVKATGEMQVIKDIYFNEELHEKVEEVAVSDGQTNPVTESALPVEPLVEAPVVSNVMSAKPFTDMKMHEVRAIAKEKGIVCTPTMKKKEIIDLISNGL